MKELFEDLSTLREETLTSLVESEDELENTQLFIETWYQPFKELLILYTQAGYDYYRLETEKELYHLSLKKLSWSLKAERGLLKSRRKMQDEAPIFQIGFPSDFSYPYYHEGNPEPKSYYLVDPRSPQLFEGRRFIPHGYLSYQEDWTFCPELITAEVLKDILPELPALITGLKAAIKSANLKRVSKAIELRSKAQEAQGLLSKLDYL